MFFMLCRSLKEFHFSLHSSHPQKSNVFNSLYLDQHVRFGMHYLLLEKKKMRLANAVHEANLKLNDLCYNSRISQGFYIRIKKNRSLSKFSNVKINCNYERVAPPTLLPYTNTKRHHLTNGVGRKFKEVGQTYQNKSPHPRFRRLNLHRRLVSYTSN